MCEERENYRYGSIGINTHTYIYTHTHKKNNFKGVCVVMLSGNQCLEQVNLSDEDFLG